VNPIRVMDDSLRSKVQDNLQTVARQRRLGLTVEVYAGQDDDRELVWQSRVSTSGACLIVGIDTDHELAMRSLWCVAYVLSAAARSLPLVPFPALPVAPQHELTVRASDAVDEALNAIPDADPAPHIVGELVACAARGERRLAVGPVTFTLVGSIGDRFFLWDAQVARHGA